MVRTIFRQNLRRTCLSIFQGKLQKYGCIGLVIVVCCATSAGTTADQADPAHSAQFISLEAAKPALASVALNDIPHPGANTTDAEWEAWLRRSDADIRQRLDAGEEDTLTNLLRFGVTFTKEYRIDDDYLVRYGESSLVNAFAEKRANDLIQVLAEPNGNQGFVEMREFVRRKGFAFASPAQRARLREYLLRNLARMRDEFVRLREQAKDKRSQLFEHRGISLDTNLWPDYDLDLQLQKMKVAGMLKAGSVKRVAIVGPGLDFVNKREGLDYYPPQTTQPFAVLDSLMRLGLADQSVKLFSLDISPRVNLHIQAARANAAAGKWYSVQLPWYTEGRWSEELRASFVPYWKNLGASIGEATSAVPVPAGSQGFQTRAVKIRPGSVNAITPVDMNIVYQRLVLPAEERFDLIIGTNVFLYYGAFEQTLARTNIAAMLKPGGYLLTNDQLQATLASGLEQVMKTEIPMTGPPVITDYVFCYRSDP